MIVNKYNNTYHSTIKTKPVDAQSSINIDSTKENNDKDPKFKAGDIARMSKYKNIFATVYTPSWPEEVFLIKKVKNTVPCIYVINYLNGKKRCWRTFYKKRNCKKRIKTFRIEKVIKKKGDKS